MVWRGACCVVHLQRPDQVHMQCTLSSAHQEMQCCAHERQAEDLAKTRAHACRQAYTLLQCPAPCSCLRQHHVAQGRWRMRHLLVHTSATHAAPHALHPPLPALCCSARSTPQPPQTACATSAPPAPGCAPSPQTGAAPGTRRTHPRPASSSSPGTAHAPGRVWCVCVCLPMPSILCICLCACVWREGVWVHGKNRFRGKEWVGTGQSEGGVGKRE